MALLPPVSTGPHIPTGATISCEVCGKVVNTADARSFSINYCTPGQGFNGTQCPSWQHFCCTHEHAVIAAIACMFEHIEPSTLFKGKGSTYGAAWLPALKTILQNYVVVQGAGGV